LIVDHLCLDLSGNSPIQGIFFLIYLKINVRCFESNR
jgi:hypothetical protein